MAARSGAPAHDWSQAPNRTPVSGVSGPDMLSLDAQARHGDMGMAGGLAAAQAQQQLLHMQAGHLASLQDLQAMQARSCPTLPLGSCEN